MVRKLIPVILSGGSGTRLWPLSTKDLPKQFAPLFDGPNLYEMTLDRVSKLDSVDRIFVVSGSTHLDLIESATSGRGARVDVVVEPSGRNTAPAIASAALLAEPEAFLVVVPSDQLVDDEIEFANTIDAAIQLAEEDLIVTLGVKPTRPDPGFGYLEVGPSLGAGNKLAGFVEKPSVDKAAEFVEGGRHRWNAGMFVGRAAVIRREIEKAVPDLLSGVQESLPDDRESPIELDASFSEVESISFDKAVMERTQASGMVTLEAGWTDVGSYRALLEASPRDADGNSIVGRVSTDNVTNSLIRVSDRGISLADLDSVAVVETATRVLVIPLDRSRAVRDLAEL